MFDDIKGQTFGRLTALKCIQKTNNKVTTLWECHCSCDDDKGKDYVSCIKTARALLIDKTKIHIPYTDFEKIDIDYLTQKIYNTSIKV